ncbi:hypothetical protein [Azospirillum sp.]|uniref:hypothetical protein n=1 Tax=Azospirillum sp. TaxID=34012 RepID=UPI003D73645F
MNRRVLACWGIVVTLLFGLAGQQAFALCMSGDHRAVEVMGHAPCGPALSPDGAGLTSGPRCDDTPVGGAMEATVQQGKRDTAHAVPTPTGGGPALPASAMAPAPPRMGAPLRAAATDRDIRLQSRRTVVLLI